MSELVEDYGWENADEPTSSSYLTPLIRSLLKDSGARRVLDLGCGNGANCSAYASDGYQVVGVEYDPKGVAIAKKHYPKIPFYNFGVGSDPRLLLTSEKKFDCVVSTEVVEHLFAPHMLPIYAHQVLAPRGKLIVTTPYHGYVKNLALALLGKWDDHHTALWHGGHIKFWSRPTLTKLLEQHGFQVVSFHGAGRVPYLWKSMVIVAEAI